MKDIDKTNKMKIMLNKSLKKLEDNNFMDSIFIGSSLICDVILFAFCSF